MSSADKSEARVEDFSTGARLFAWLQAARTAAVKALRIAAMVGRKRTGSDSQARAWSETIGQVIVDLERLNHVTEQDFLKIGGKLAEFIDAVKVISSELTALADSMSGEHGLRASQSLTYALDRSKEMGTRYGDRNGSLGGMRQEAARLQQTLTGFEGIVSTFQTLGVLTRIEAARLGSAGSHFGSLADDVKVLAADVEARVDSALDTAALLMPPLESAMQNMAALEEGQAKDLPSVIASVLASLASLSSFRDIQQRAQESSVRLGAQYHAISLAFKKLIVSVQFHDITRQQVEHVIEALQRLCSASEGGEGDRRDPATVLALQSLQLADAGEKFAVSVASVAQNLEDIATHVLEMAEESRTLSGLSEAEKNSFFLQMERGCTAILDSLSQGASAEAATRVTSGSLVGTIGRMRGSVEEIRAIEIQMQLMALNASIRAAHIGVSGDALGVLAGSMQQQAFASRQRSESLVETLGSMSEAVARLSGQGDSVVAEEDGNQDGGLEGLRAAVADLHASSERCFVHVAQIIESGARLREDLAATREGFAVGALFAEAVSRAREMLQEIVDENQAGASHYGSESLEPGLADSAGHYTMQSERDVHERLTGRVVGPVLVPARAEAPDSSPVDVEEVGENVEFF